MRRDGRSAVVLLGIVDPPPLGPQLGAGGNAAAHYDANIATSTINNTNNTNNPTAAHAHQGSLLRASNRSRSSMAAAASKGLPSVRNASLASVKSLRARSCSFIL